MSRTASLPNSSLLPIPHNTPAPVVLLFRKAQSHPSPTVMIGVTMPCLKILQSLISPKDFTSSNNKVSHTPSRRSQSIHLRP